MQHILEFTHHKYDYLIFIAHVFVYSNCPSFDVLVVLPVYVHTIGSNDLHPEYEYVLSFYCCCISCISVNYCNCIPYSFWDRITW